MDVYAQAVTEKKRNAQTKVVELVVASQRWQQMRCQPTRTASLEPLSDEGEISEENGENIPVFPCWNAHNGAIAMKAPAKCVLFCVPGGF